MRQHRFKIRSCTRFSHVCFVSRRRFYSSPYQLTTYAGLVLLPDVYAMMNLISPFPFTTHSRYCLKDPRRKLHGVLTGNRYVCGQQVSDNDFQIPTSSCIASSLFVLSLILIDLRSRETTEGNVEYVREMAFLSEIPSRVGLICAKYL